MAAHVTANMTPRETRASNLIECLLQLDLDVHASGELEAHQSLDRFLITKDPIQMKKILVDDGFVPEVM